MSKSINILRLLKGTVQGEQTPAALQPNYFSVDERDSKKLLSYSAAVASVLDYYSLNGNKDGAWDTLMLSDVSVLTARISQYDGTEKHNQFLGFQNAIELEPLQEERLTFIQKLFQLGFETVLQVNAWYKLSSQNFSAAEMTLYLKNEITSNGSEMLRTFYGHYFTLTETNPAFGNEALRLFTGLDRHWGFNPFPEQFKKFSLAEASRYGQRLFSWVDEIVSEACEEFERSLRRNDIPPHVGLMLSFIDIFKYQQDAMNTITSRHLDFYYQELLRGTKKKAQPDKAIIILELATGTDQQLIAKGTQTDAGKTSNDQPIVFSTTEDAVVTKTRIADFLTLTFTSSGTPVDHDILTGTVKKFNEIGNSPWPLFGANASGENVTVTSATLGFAFSCPDLFLAQSSRQVKITFSINTTDGNVFDDLPSHQIFDLRLTSATGWFTANIDAVVYNNKEKTFVISFSLNPADPAVIAYSEKLHGTGFDTRWPVCKISLASSGKRVYNKLKELSVSSVSVSASVKGLSNFLVENDSGKLSPSVPFSPFNVSTQGNNLYIGGQELFVKQLSDVTLTITWDKLPKSFKDYYQAYNDYYAAPLDLARILKPVFQNQAFAVTVSTLANGVWVPAVNVPATGKTLPQFKLFTDDAVSDFPEHTIVVDGKKKIVINKAVIKESTASLPSNPDLPSFSGLNNTLQEGFFCLTLSSPSKGFGYIDYPTIVSSVAMTNSEIIIDNAKILTFKKKKLNPLPNIPYVPKIKVLEVDYSSSQQYHAAVPSSLKCFHLHPFGINEISLSKSPVPLLPNYPCVSYNYFAFDDLVLNTDLSLCFVLNNRTGSVVSTGGADVTYEYLSVSGWKPLTLLSDSTEGFQCTGILRFSVPADATNSSTEMTKLYWFRMGKNTIADITTQFVSTQAVMVERVLNTDNKLIPVPTGTISHFVSSMPGVKKIVQPIISYGAVSAQTEDEFRSDVATRLRYKKRITSVSDIESIVLNEFPQIFKVVAIPNSRKNASGAISVVVTPFTDMTHPNKYEPLALGEVMDGILNFLSSAGLPSMKYEISNPKFHRLIVSCQVVFSALNHDAALAKRLNDDINNFLSPWIKDNPIQGIVFTSAGSANQLYSFVKSQEYIRHVRDFKVTLDDPKVNINDVLPQALIICAPQHIINVNASKPDTDSSTDTNNGIRIGENFYITD